jgi:hypothetical protein
MVELIFVTDKTVAALITYLYPYLFPYIFGAELF